MNKHKFKFRKEPLIFNYFKLENNFEKPKYINTIDIIQQFKIGGFKIGNFFASFWFGVMLFFLQSYFLKQNLKPDQKFISD